MWEEEKWRENILKLEIRTFSFLNPTMLKKKQKKYRLVV